jgi:hypothetical protein
MDRQGVEITGQANAASQLIPLLEASPWLERVEFTSPVTKGQGKEQFRVKAAWEPGPKDRVGAPPPPPAVPPGAVPARPRRERAVSPTTIDPGPRPRLGPPARMVRPAAEP